MDDRIQHGLDELIDLATNDAYDAIKNNDIDKLNFIEALRELENIRNQRVYVEIEGEK